MSKYKINVNSITAGRNVIMSDTPQPQPDGDWATKAAEEIAELPDLFQFEWQADIERVAEVLRRHAPAPAPATANEGAHIRRAALEEAAEYIRGHYPYTNGRFGQTVKVVANEKSVTAKEQIALADAMLKALGDL